MSKKSNIHWQDDIPFKSLDFPGRTMLTVPEVCEKLGIGIQHLLDLIDEGEIAAVNIAGGRERKHWRIPIEGYRDFIIKRMNSKGRRTFLRELPPATLHEVFEEIRTILTLRTNTAF